MTAPSQTLLLLPLTSTTTSVHQYQPTQRLALAGGQDGPEQAGGNAPHLHHIKVKLLGSSKSCPQTLQEL